MAIETQRPLERPAALAALPAKLWLVAVLLLVAAAIFFVWLAGARFQYQEGLTLSRQNDWLAARARLLRAAANYGVMDASVTDANTAATAIDKTDPVAPWRVPAVDARRLYIALGDNFLAEATAVAKTTAALFATLKKSESYFAAALRLQPLDVRAQTGLARATAALQRGFPWFRPGKKNIYNAEPEFEKLLRLRPNGIEAHMLFIRYLNNTGQNDKRLRELAENLAAIMPQTAGLLQRDLAARSDWKTQLEPALNQGLRAAIAEGRQPAAAYRVLSLLAAAGGDQAAAIGNLQQALTANTAGDGNKAAAPTAVQMADYSRLVDLYLRQGGDQAPEAQRTALQALRLSAGPDQTLHQLWRIYKENKQLQLFLNMLAEAENAIRLPETRHIVRAACLTELGDTATAQASLLLVKDRQYQAEALRALAELARRDKNWDAMELAAQRLTVIEPKNTNNFHLFVQSLRAQKKYRQVAEALDQAIATNEDAGLYNLRAQNRWNDQQFAAARADWLQAIKLSPENAGLYHSLAMTYEKEGARAEAIAAMKKAVSLAPGNASFLKKLQELQN